MRIVISGIPIDVQKKNIKNMIFTARRSSRESGLRF